MRIWNRLLGAFKWTVVTPDSDWEIWYWNKKRPVTLIDGAVANPMIIASRVRAGKAEYRRVTVEEQLAREQGLDDQMNRVP